MPDIHKKIRAVRRLCGLTQSEVAKLAHIHVKTYQRMEAGTSPVTEDMLEAFAVIFDCRPDDIRHFNLETNQFEAPEHILPEEERLKTEISRLKAENDHLKRLLGRFMDKIPDFQMQGKNAG